MRRYLIVGNQTLRSDALRAAAHKRAEAGDAQFRIVVPPTHNLGAWSEGQACAAAEERLADALARFREEGIDVDGSVGDPRPVAAVADALLADPAFDEIIVSTFRMRQSTR